MDSDQQATSAAGPITESPWFWVLLFANVAIIGGVLIAPKYNRRQATLERKFETRREVARQAVGGEGESTAQPATDGPQIVPLTPLFVFLMTINLLAMFFHFRQRMRRYQTERQPQ
jgi:hypothetical protein